MADLLSIVEAAYSPASSEGAWLGSLVASAAAIDRGGGAWGQTYFTHLGQVRIRSAAGQNPSYEATRQTAMLKHFGQVEVAQAYPPRPQITGFLEISGLSQLESGRFFEGMGTGPRNETGYIDALGVLAGDPTGYGCLVCSPSKTRVTVTRREARVLTQVAVHVAHAYRLQRAKAPESPTDAVLDPGGKLQHVESAHVGPDDQAALREATRQVDRARGKLRRASQEEALSLWRGLVVGQWSLVDHIDHDGRRYVLACRNAPVRHDWRSLTAREHQVVAYAAHGHPPKLLAYELGLAVSSVTGHLATAARKVKARSRTHLLAMYLQEHGTKQVRGELAVDEMTSGARKERGESSTEG